jgi:hypothetical protein
MTLHKLGKVYQMMLQSKLLGKEENSQVYAEIVAAIPIFTFIFNPFCNKIVTISYPCGC